MMARKAEWLKRRMAIIRKQVAEFNSLWAPQKKAPVVCADDEMMALVAGLAFTSGRSVIANIGDDGKLHVEYAGTAAVSRDATAGGPGRE